MILKKLKEETEAVSCGGLRLQRVAMIHTYTAQITFWGGKYGSLILMLAPLKSELRLKRLAKISGKTATRSSPAPISFGNSRYIHTHTHKFTAYVVFYTHTHTHTHI